MCLTSADVRQPSWFVRSAAVPTTPTWRCSKPFTWHPNVTMMPRLRLRKSRQRDGEEETNYGSPGKGQSEAASLLGPGRRAEEEDDGDEGEDEFEGVELPKPSVLRRAAAFVLKRPYVAGLAILALVLILPLISALFAAKETYLTCEDEEIPSPQQIFATMSVREKIGQMVIADLPDTDHGDAVLKYLIGGVIPPPGGKLPLGSGPQDWLKTSSHLQARALQTPKRIPLLFGADVIHGHGGVYGATIFPHPIGLGATHNTTLAQLVGLAVAREMRATGVRWGLGPSLSVCRDPRWGGCYESFAEHERLVRMMEAITDGFAGQEEGSAWASIEAKDILVASTGLGFMGDGGTAGGVSGGVTNEEDDRFRQLFMRPFFDAVSRGVPLVQLAMGHVNGEPIHNSSYLFGILKQQLRYRGVVVSARGGIQEVPGDFATQVRTAVNRGVDMFMVGPGKVRSFVTTLRGEVATGGVPMERIDDAVRRILRLKLEMALFRSPCGTHGLGLEVVGAPEHRGLARSAVRQSLVLLKNGGGDQPMLLPLPTDSVKVLVTGSHADNLGYQCGGHTMTLQGSSGRTTEGTTILEGIKAALGATATLIHRADPSPSEEADYAIVVVGEQPYAGAAGDRGNSTEALHLDEPSKQLVTKVCTRMPCLVILVTGRPLEIDSLVPFVHALVVAWLPGTEGAGVADMIFQGKGSDFGGTLPVTWFKQARQLPMNFGDAIYKPLFPYGFGLTLNGTILNGAFASKDN